MPFAASPGEAWKASSSFKLLLPLFLRGIWWREILSPPPGSFAGVTQVRPPVVVDFFSSLGAGAFCPSMHPFPSPGDLPDPGIEPRSPALQADALTSEPPGKLHAFISHTLLSPALGMPGMLCPVVGAGDRRWIQPRSWPWEI